MKCRAWETRTVGMAELQAAWEETIQELPVTWAAAQEPVWKHLAVWEEAAQGIAREVSAPWEEMTWELPIAWEEASWSCSKRCASPG